MFGHKAGPSRVYKYGCGKPCMGEEQIDTAMYLAHKYRNRLVEIEVNRRNAVQEILSSDPRVAELENTIQANEEQLQATRARIALSRKKGETSLTPQEKQECEEKIKALMADLRKTHQELKELKKERLADPEIQAELAEVNKRVADEVKATRQACGLYWGTYLMVEHSFDKAKRSTGELKFKRWDGRGHLAVQLQKGLPVDKVFETDNRVRIEPVPEEAWTSESRSVRRKLSRTRIWIRIGSDGKEPVWAVLPMVMHRPLPKGGSVKWVHLIRERVGTHYRYSVHFVVELPEEPKVELGPGTVAIDVGWRLMDEGLRVAYWYDSDGNEGDLRLPDALLNALQKPDDIRAIRDRNFNEAKDALGQRLQSLELPAWLKERSAHLTQWRSTPKLAALAIEWRDKRFPGDEEVFAGLEEWRKRDKHLYEYEANLRDQATTRRREVYRVFAADLRRRYNTVILEKFDLREVAEQPNPEEGPKESSRARDLRVKAAISELRQTIANAGLKVVEVPAENSTRQCHVCGHIDAFDTAKWLMHQCSKCGAVWDQDRNAAVNLLARGNQAARTESGQEIPEGFALCYSTA